MLTAEAKTHKAIKKILSALPAEASRLVRKHQDMSLEVNRSFAKYPDDPAMHQPQWHQFGIITHSKRFQVCLEREVPTYLSKWGVQKAVEEYFQQEIDGWSRWQLLQIVAIVHDIGKFTARQVWEKPDGSIGCKFSGHESHSGTLLRGESRSLLGNAGFTANQITYIAMCAQRHFDLGIVREAAKPNFTIRFVGTGAFSSAVQKILYAHGDIALEIFLCFLADNVSKTEVYATAETDAAIVFQDERLKKELEHKRLSSELLGAALQMPVNIMVAQRAVQLWAKTQ